MPDFKFGCDSRRIVWQTEPDRPWEINGFLHDNIQGEMVHVAHVFTDLGCAGYWYCWDGYPGSVSKDRRYNGRCVDSSALGLIGTMKLVEDKLKEVSA